MNNKTQLGCLIILALCISTSTAQRPVRVSVETVQLKDFTHGVEVPTTIKSNEIVDMYSKVGGFLKTINVDIGDIVEAGQVLAELEIPEMESQLAQKESRVKQSQAELAQAKAAIRQSKAQLSSFRAGIEEATTERAQKSAMLEYEQRELSRLSNLADQGAIRRELVDSAQYKYQAAEAALAAGNARVRTAQANLAGAEANVDKARADAEAANSRVDVAKADLEYVRRLADYATLRAPFDGQITKRMYDPGAFVQSADGNSAAKPILQVAQMDKVRATFSLSMSDISALNRGDRVVISRIAALPGKTFEGTVSRFSAALDEKSRMLKAEVDLANANHELNPGYFGYAKVFIAEFKHAAVIPSSAVRGQGNEQHVFLAVGNKAVRRAVTVGFNNGKNAIVSSGLTGGEKLIVNGSNRVSNGQAIETK